MANSNSSDGPLLICGAVLIDDLAFADGRTLDGVLGGAALHALAGAALWSDDVVLVSGAGLDAESHILPWMRRAGLGAERLKLAGAFTPRNILVYHAGAPRTETPAFGPEHFERLQPTSADLVAALPGAAGVYVFRDARLSFWAPVLEAARRHATPVLWEISADACEPGQHEQIAAVAGQVAALSINLEETLALFGHKPLEALTEDLRALGAGTVFLRCGADGSRVITANAVAAIPACSATVVDVTGAGNAYGGAALAGLKQGPVQAGRMGAVAARFAIAQYGPFDPRDPHIRAQALEALALAAAADPA
jgi:sugar/nucleoside kinase (ribokinase family)